MMDFRILGSLEVADGSRRMALGGAKQKAVLAILLLHRGEPVTVDRLVDELWGEAPPDTAVKTVQVYISRLRKELGDGVLLTRQGRLRTRHRAGPARRRQIRAPRHRRSRGARGR